MGKLVINEGFLQQIETLQTLIKNNIAGLFGGNHQSKTFGSSCEFSDYREYQPGDDVSKIDWKAYARFDKLYQKLYLDERQMHTRIYIDASRSMDYGEGHKAEQALKLAAAFAYMSVCEMDKVSIYAIKDKTVQELVVGMRGKDAYIAGIGALNSLEFSGDSYITDALIPTNVGMGDGMSIIISDFLTDNDYERAIHHLVDKKRDVLCLQILSREELNPQARGKMHFFDSEDLEKTYRKHIDKEIIQAYRMALAYVTDKVKNCCASRGANYMLVGAEDKLAQVFFGNFVDIGVLK